MTSLDPLEQTDSSDQASQSNQDCLESQEHPKDQSNSQSLREQGQPCPNAGEAFS